MVDSREGSRLPEWVRIPQRFKSNPKAAPKAHMTGEVCGKPCKVPASLCSPDFTQRALRTSCQWMWDAGAFLRSFAPLLWMGHPCSLSFESFWDRCQYAWVYTYRLSAECVLMLHNKITSKFAFCRSCSSFCERAAGENFAGCLFNTVFHRLSSAECL